MSDGIIPSQRHRFAIPEGLHYLNCAYMAPLSHKVVEAMQEGSARKAAPWTYRPDDFFSLAEHFRSRAARLADVAPETIAIVPSASYGLAVAAKNVPIAKGQAIVTLAEQFPSNVYVWRDVAEKVGASLEQVQRDASSCWTHAVLEAIDDRTAVVAVPHCHWADGRLVDLEEVGAKCRRYGAALVLDLTQSLGAVPLDLDAVRPDFAVAAAYKWMMGPYGIGMLYCDPRHFDGAPLEHNWMSRAGSEDFAGLVDYREDFQPGARRFDMGEKSNPPLLMGASAAIDFLLEFGVSRISKTLGEKTARLAQMASDAGFSSAPQGTSAPHYLSLDFPGGVPASIMTRLSKAQVFVSARGKSMRITPHLYNTDEDAEALIAALQR